MIPRRTACAPAPSGSRGSIEVPSTHPPGEPAMTRTITSLACLAGLLFVVVATTWGQDARPSAKEQEQKLIAVLKSAAPQKEKADACRELGARVPETPLRPWPRCSVTRNSRIWLGTAWSRSPTRLWMMPCACARQPERPAAGRCHRQHWCAARPQGRRTADQVAEGKGWTGGPGRRAGTGAVRHSRCRQGARGRPGRHPSRQSTRVLRGFVPVCRGPLRSRPA